MFNRKRNLQEYAPTPTSSAPSKLHRVGESLAGLVGLPTGKKRSSSSKLKRPTPRRQRIASRGGTLVPGSKRKLFEEKGLRDSDPPYRPNKRSKSQAMAPVVGRWARKNTKGKRKRKFGARKFRGRKKFTKVRGKRRGRFSKKRKMRSWLKSGEKLTETIALNQNVGGNSSSTGFTVFADETKAWSAATTASDYKIHATHGCRNYGYNTNGLFSKSDCQEFLDAVTTTNTSTSRRKFLVKGWREELWFQNIEPHDIIVDLYRIKRIRASSRTMLDHMADGMAALNSAPVAGFSAPHLGAIQSNIKMSTDFRRFFKILTHRQMTLKPGQCYRKVYKSGKPFMMDGSVISTYEQSGRAGEKFWMLSSFGCPLPSASTGTTVDQVTFSDVRIYPLIIRNYYVAGVIDTNAPTLTVMGTHNFSAIVAAGTERTMGPPAFIGSANAVPLEPATI